MDSIDIQRIPQSFTELRGVAEASANEVGRAANSWGSHASRLTIRVRAFLSLRVPRQEAESSAEDIRRQVERVINAARQFQAELNGLANLAEYQVNRVGRQAPTNERAEADIPFKI